jgi:hypothetical protein
MTGFIFKDTKFIMKTTALALMGTASFCAIFSWPKRYSGQQEMAPEK